jgi:hypothetical protein
MSSGDASAALQPDCSCMIRQMRRSPRVTVSKLQDLLAPAGSQSTIHKCQCVCACQRQWACHLQTWRSCRRCWTPRQQSGQTSGKSRCTSWRRNAPNGCDSEVAEEHRCARALPARSSADAQPGPHSDSAHCCRCRCTRRIRGGRWNLWATMVCSARSV